MLKVTIAAAATLFAMSAYAQDEADLTTGDADAGERVFRQCQACHAVGDGASNRVGPQLNELFGRVPGSLEDYNYSPAMVSYGEEHVWDAPTLAAYLQAPREVVDGTKMAFAGLRNEQDVKDVLAYVAQFDADGFEVEAAAE